MDVDDKLTVIYSAADSLQARYLQNLLEQEGIPSTVINEPVAGAAFTYPLGWATAPRVLVPLEYAEVARSIALEYDETIRTAALTDFGDDALGDDASSEAKPAANWPVCPMCDTRRQTECPACGSGGDDFPLAQASAALLAGAKDLLTEQAASDERAIADRKRPWLLCPTCDEVFQPPYERRCACGHDFGEGREEPVAPTRDRVDRRFVWLLVGIVAAGIGALLYFALILRP
jgi:hypothetical protein